MTEQVEKETVQIKQDVPLAMYTALRTQAARERRPANQIVLEAIDQYLKQTKKSK